MTNKPEPITRAGEAQAHQLATALMGVERFTADGNFHPDYLAMLTRPLPQPSDTWRDSQFLVATVSQDGREVGIDHPTDANWDDVLRAHISLRDRINERLAKNGNCPFKPQPSELVAEVKRLTALAGDHFRNARRLSEVVVAREAQIAKLQADGDKLAGALEAFQRHYDLNDCDERCGALEVPISDLRRARQALAAKGDSRG